MQSIANSFLFNCMLYIKQNIFQLSSVQFISHFIRSLSHMMLDMDIVNDSYSVCF